MIWKEDRSRIRVVQMDSLIGWVLGVLNAPIRELCGVTKKMMKGLIKVFSDGSAILNEWGTIGFLNGYIRRCEGGRLVGRPQNKEEVD